MPDQDSGADPWRLLGEELAERRSSAGYTQRRFAAREEIHYGRSTIANVERGRQRVSRDFWHACDIALKTGGVLVNKYERINAELTAQRLHEIDTIASSHTTDARPRASLPPTARPGPRTARPEEATSSVAFSGIAASASAVEGADRIRQAMADPARYADAGFVGAFRVQLETAKALDGRYGAASALATAKGVIDVVESVAPDVPEKVRGDVLVLGAEAAEFVGWLFRDLADPVQAGYWYDRAMEYAQLCGDLSWQGFVLLRKSQMAYESRSANRVRLFARAAIDGPWQLSARFYAEALLQVARGDLMLGQRVDLGTAVEQARDASAGEDLTLREASCWIEAQEPERAAQLYEAGLTSDGLSLRDAGYFQARQAVALAHAQAPDLAAERAYDALTAAARTGSRRTHRAVVATRAALAPWKKRDSVAALDDALTAYESSSRRPLESPGPATAGFAD
ncbi:helix-turn-helix domain-containing protein [Actinoplanes sp. CA-030573]|uniref:helix-turn-helix domain-containing protein n=1 Tax=Actinoplanes sp. CA-030573 TaxID=3239898 RepID=UPI003D9200F0